MVLFDADGVIKRYECAEDILRDFFMLRMEYYSKRRLALIQVPLSIVFSASTAEMSWQTQHQRMAS